MELLDFTKDYTGESLKEEIRLWIASGRMEAEMETAIPTRQILWFLKSRIGKRVQKATQKGKAYKERQFVIGLPLSQMEAESESRELAVVQGIIDLYFIEEDGIVLVDYKTDRIKRGEENVLVGHYKVQIDAYRKALEQMTGKKVKEAYIASLTLCKNIEIS
jgi:ATP-dependent helicase/nuclease subunit A